MTENNKNVFAIIINTVPTLYNKLFDALVFIQSKLNYNLSEDDKNDINNAIDICNKELSILSNRPEAITNGIIAIKKEIKEIKKEINDIYKISNTSAIKNRLDILLQVTIEKVKDAILDIGGF